MRRTTHWLVADGATSEESPDSCVACGASIGTEHKEMCPVRSRTVVLKIVVELVDDVPEHWDTDLINDYYSSECGTAQVSRAIKTAAIMGKGGNCLCGFVTSTYIREATSDEETRQCKRVNELRS